MIYSGKAISVHSLEGGIAELRFDLQGESINKFNELTTSELKLAGEALMKAGSIKGMLVTSAKEAFIVGADITEFGKNFQLSEEEIAKSVFEINQYFNVIEDLPFPTVTLINGYALGGGLEMALCTDFRIMAAGAKVGLPETKLGIMPGFGGTVRLPRLIGPDNAFEWIAGGKDQKAEAALSAGAVDAVVAQEDLLEAGLALLAQAIEGKIDYLNRRDEKKAPLQLNDIEALMSFETAKAFIAGKAGPHYPAPVSAVKAIQKAAKLERDAALEVEASFIARLAKTQVAKNLVGLFLADQALIKTAKSWAEQSTSASRTAVLGAGIMGGGIAYQSASKGTPIIMKDINQAGLDLGLSEAAKLLTKLVSRERITNTRMAEVLNMITPALTYDQFDQLDLVVEAVVENPKVKHSVLAEVEACLNEHAILTSNTSTISINYLAKVLKRPENFCGMHFFNPVHKMPLVEVIRGEKTSDAAVARTVAYALAMDKKPVVVQDCPGFLVNRILAPYMGGFLKLLKDGADFIKIDKVMEKAGWPMGPAYLCDVVGLDTSVHAGSVMSEGFPDRLANSFKTATTVLFESERFGQKNSKGFYAYEIDKKGKSKKLVDDSVKELLAPHCDEPAAFSDEEILDRLMIPLCLEAVRCLEEGIAQSASDIDMALIYGIGFPPFLGGALTYIDDMGVQAFIAKADQYTRLGALYEPTERLREMAANNEKFYA